LNAKGVVLVVDDTPDSLQLITEVLAGEGYLVRPADSGELALNAAAAINPELILLDVRMPGMNGFEVCRRLKERAETRDIPVIFVSATGDPDERLEGWKIGAVDFVSKPFERQELLARVAARLELSRLRKELEQMIAAGTASLEAANRQLREELAERARAELALRESEARFRSMADTVSAGIWTSGPDTRINYCNAYMQQFTGKPLEELIGDRWKDVIHPEDLELKYPAYLPLIEGRRHYVAEYRLRRADGEYRWMLDTATPRFLGDRSFAGYVGILMDITDLRRNQEQFLAAQKLESLGVLVAGVAHRFNNLLGTIIAEADLAASDIPDDSIAQESVSRINATAIRASEIVALLMAYAGHAASGAPTWLNLSHAVQESVRLFKATALSKAAFVVSLTNKLPPIRADLSQIDQIVINLLTNARESLQDQQGSIRLATSMVSVEAGSEEAEHGSLLPGDYVQLEVSDTGCGIAEDARLRVFDPFYTTKSLGRGLGLSAVQGIVRSLGGTIRVQSTAGQGSTFQVLFPAFSGSAAQDAESRTEQVSVLAVSGGAKPAAG
jgi:PAS domain S-box-containing protein